MEKTFWEKLLGASPDLTKGAAFYSQPVGFSKLFLHGIESHILYGYMALFAYIDFQTGNPLSAAGLVWMIDLILVLLREHFGTVNLSQKTLLDSKFLI
jgi:meckelin